MESFSQKLAGARKKQNLSIEEIADKTKIRHNILEAIEEGDFTVLPEVYLKSFVKTYALFLKFNESEISSALDRIFSKKVMPVTPPVHDPLERYQEKSKDKNKEKPVEKQPEKKREPEPKQAVTVQSSEQQKETSVEKNEEKQKQAELKKKLKEEKQTEKEKIKRLKQEEKEREKADRQAEKEKAKVAAKEQETPTTRKLDQESLNNLFFGSAGKKKSMLKTFLKWTGLVVLVVAAVFVVLMLFWPDSTQFLNSFLKEEDKRKISGDTVQVQNPNSINNQRVVLIARAIDTTSFRIHVDNQTDESITLYPGKSKLWEANKQIELSGVIVGTVEFTRNNELLQPFGDRGTVVRKITIFRDKIQSSSANFDKDTIPFVSSKSLIPVD